LVENKGKLKDMGMDLSENRFSKVTHHQSHPLVTFALIAYNQEPYIGEAIQGAFAQTYSPLEIILSDDYSSDRTFEIMTRMAEAYDGPHKIILNRNEKNLGTGGHVNRIMELSNGQLIVGAAGDDISLPERVNKIYMAYKESGGSAKSIFSNGSIIDKSGEKLRPLYISPPDAVLFSPEMIVKSNSIVPGCSHAWAREVFDLFGPLAIPLSCEDIVIPLRSALTGEIRYIHEDLMMYRRHDANTCAISAVDPPKDYSKWERFWCREKLAIFNNWLRDLASWEEFYPAQQDRVASLRTIILERLALARADLCFMESSWLRKAMLLLQELSRGEPARAVGRRVGVFLIPRIYNKYAMIKNARR
jgi:glycosyltransferase involved in cell wall biosynthesis